MASRYFVDVTETYKARVEVSANSPEEAEEAVDELVGGGKVDVVKLALASDAKDAYSKVCDVCML